MTDLARVKLFEAERFIEDAATRAEVDDPFSPSVAIAHACDAIILAIDALCHHADVPPAKRHDQATESFLRLIRTEKISPSGARFRDFLVRAMNERNSFQYAGELTSRTKARAFVRSSRDVVDFVRAELEGAPAVT